MNCGDPLLLSCGLEFNRGRKSSRSVNPTFLASFLIKNILQVAEMCFLFWGIFFFKFTRNRKFPKFSHFSPRLQNGYEITPFSFFWESNKNSHLLNDYWYYCPIFFLAIQLLGCFDQNSTHMFYISSEITSRNCFFAVRINFLNTHPAQIKTKIKCGRFFHVL